MAEYIERGALKEYLYGGKFQEGCTGCDEPGTETDLAAFDEAHDLERGLKHIELYC